ncbi:MAG: PAS domain-containing protein [Bacteroidetes bacterium]|nr:PAS domain-containing protein [Bacteroidota bacterium]MBU1372450.1 PAS domain-containing protein [Bacteroidota bacterium]MBU1483474.1 PAS domain-containing protein [Bacteroidota bacterium]MBU1761375.1 PAS domain-containing protein [Bacteroidota bacterium]MBU2269180.1 PAS domain-containing protein [Bacteroidota bacterium]
MALKSIAVGKEKKGFNVPFGYFWAILIICIAPTILAIFEIEISYNDYRIISFSKITQDVSTTLILGRTFTTIWIIFSIAVGIFTCILTLIDFRVKRNVATPILGLLMVCVSVFDMVQLLIILGAFDINLDADEAIYFSWFLSRILHASLLILGTIVILNNSSNKLKTDAQKIRLIKTLGWIFVLVTFALIFYLLNVKSISPFFITRDAFFTHPLELISIVLYLIWGGLMMPRVLKLYNGIFFRMLILSMIPAIFSDAHMSVFYKNFDIEYNFAQFLKFITYVVPLLGISLNYARNITKQHQMNMVLDEEIKAKEKVQRDLERRQNILKHAEKLANMGSWDLDVVTKEINFSDALYKIFGYMPNSISPSLELMYNMIIPDFRSEYQNMLENAIRNKSSFNTEYEVLWVNGERRYILAQCRYINEDQKIIGTCLDITELKETSRKLSQNEILLKEAESISHNGSFEWFAGVDHFFWSDELFRIHGYEPNITDITLAFYKTLIHPEDLEKCQNTVNKIIENKKDFSLEYRIIRPDKEVRYVYITAKVIINKEENINKIIGNLQDITELKNAAILLEETESIYKTIASNVPDSILLMYDRNYKIILFDGPILEHVKFKTELVPGLHISELFAGEELQENIQILDKAFRGEEIQIEKDFEEEKTFMIDFKPVKNATGEIFNVMVVMHDITEIKKVQKSLESKVEELNRSNQDLEQFAYVASHDLQEPLRKIRSFGDRLQNKYSGGLPEEGLDYIKRMQSASERMQTLIDDLLTFSRVTRTDEGYESVDLHDQIQKILEDLEFTIEKKNATIDLMVNHTISAIPGQIRQLFQNLISNAIKFTKEGVPPIVEIKSEILRGEVLSPNLEPNKDFCRIVVKDNGIGFDQQYADKIFELFQRLHTRNEYQGTGIGLAVCKKIVDKHGGLINVNSIQEEGTTFTIILPLIH